MSVAITSCSQVMIPTTAYLLLKVRYLIWSSHHCGVTQTARQAAKADSRGMFAACQLWQADEAAFCAPEEPQQRTFCNGMAPFSACSMPVT